MYHLYLQGYISFRIFNSFPPLGLIQYMIGAETEPKLPRVWSSKIIYSLGVIFPAWDFALGHIFVYFLPAVPVWDFALLRVTSGKAQLTSCGAQSKKDKVLTYVEDVSNAPEMSEEFFCLILFTWRIKMRGIFCYETNTNPVTRRSYDV